MPFCDLNTDIKPWLGIDVSNTTHDSVLTIIRDSVEQAVLNYTEAKFEATVITNEILDSSSADTVVTKNHPVISVEALYFSVDSDGTDGNLIDPEHYFVNGDGGITLRAITQPRGRFLTRVDYTYGYTALPGDVKHAILLAVEADFRRKGRKLIGVSSRSKKNESEGFESSSGVWDTRVGLPKEVVAKLNPYRVNFEFPVQPMATRNF